MIFDSCLKEGQHDIGANEWSLSRLPTGNTCSVNVAFGEFTKPKAYMNQSRFFQREGRNRSGTESPTLLVVAPLSLFSDWTSRKPSIHWQGKWLSFHDGQFVNSQG
jgi:hypothetical protein